MICFIYHSDEDLRVSQQVLVDLAMHLLDNFTKVPKELEPLYGLCLTAIMQRGEFDLHFMGFNQGNYLQLPMDASITNFSIGELSKKDSNNKTSDMKYTAQKEKLAISYQKFL